MRLAPKAGPTLARKSGLTLAGKTPAQAKPEPGTLEADCAEELGELETGWRERQANEKARFEDAADAEYWCCLVFQSRAQKNEWLQKAGLGPIEARFIDGMEVAGKMGIQLATPIPKLTRSRTQARLAKLER